MSHCPLLTGNDTYPEVAVHTPAGYTYYPNYCQFLYPDLGINAERNLGPLVSVKFQKEHDHTVLQITWEGNLR